MYARSSWTAWSGRAGPRGFRPGAILPRLSPPPTPPINRLALITNGMPAAQAAKLQRLGLDNHFESLIASSDIGVGKPAAEIFRHALTVMGTTAEDSIMVGDSFDGDVMGAKRAGMKACWVRRDTSVPKDNEDGVPIIPDLTSLEALLQPPPAREPRRIIAP